MNQQKFNGNRLKTARQYRGKSLSDLAKDVEVTKQAISQYENGECMPDDKIFFRIINVLNFPWNYFYEKDNNNIETQTTYFRSLLKTYKKDRIAQTMRIEYLILLYEFLETYIDFPKLNIKNFSISEDEINLDYIEEVSCKLRNYWKLGSNPIKDLIYELEKNGIILTSLETTTNDIDAYSQKLKVDNISRFVVILSNNKNCKVRQHFDAAHELGHIVLHNFNEDMEALSKEDFTKMEKQANLFAASFLLPKDAFLEDVSFRPNSLEHYKNLKLKWNASIMTMIIRAFSLSAITPNQYQYLMRQYSYKGWRRKEPYDNDLLVPEPTILRNAVEKIIGSGFMTGEQLISEFSNKYNLSLARDEIESLLNLEKNTLLDNKEEVVLDFKKEYKQN